MTRAEELTLKLADGELSDEEFLELERVLKQDPSAAGAHLALLDLEAELRASEGDSEVPRKTMERIREKMRLQKSVMNRIRAEQPPEWLKNAARPRTTRRTVPFRGGKKSVSGAFWIAGLAAAGAFLLVLLLTPSTPPPTGIRLSGQDRAKQEALWRKAEAERAGAESARREAEQRLATLREEEHRAEAARRAAQASREEDRKKADEAFQEIVRKMKAEEERLARLREEERKAEAAQRELVPPAPPEAPPEKRATEATLARLERADAGVLVMTTSGKSDAKGGQDLAAGHGVETPAGGSAVLTFPDKTRIEIAANTEIKLVPSEGGKRVFVARGETRAVVTKQPKGQPMVFETPHGEAIVRGTTLRVRVDLDPRKGTTLDVEEGKVELQNLAGRTVLVDSGHYAVAASGTELTVRAGSSTSSLNQGLVGRWTFDEGAGLVAGDASGLGHDGQLTNKPGWVRQGKLGGALQLDGIKSYVMVPRKAALEPAALTITLWIRRNGPQAAYAGTLITKTGLGSFGSWGLQLVSSGNLVSFDTVHDGAFQNLRSPEGAVPDGAWTHIAAVYDPSGAAPQKRLYINGNQLASGVESRPLPYDAKDDLYFGGAVPFGKEYYRGLLDDVRIYNRPLSPEEIRTLVKQTDR